jgi:exodeoxyribonuclease V alpha subunit
MTPATPPPLELEMEGTVERFIFHNEDNGFSVFKLSLPRKNREITAVGTLSAVKPGEYLRLKGAWVQDKEYGPQFQVASYLSILPGTLTGIEKYLGSGLIYGVGKETAKRMVRAFGLDILDILDNEPERLREIEGIGVVKQGRIVAGWRAHREIKDVMIFLQSIGISGAYAAKIYKTYGSGVIAAVKEDPYRLAMDISGIGFKTADKIAANLGIPSTSPRRARAGVLHVLGQVSDKGHVCFPLPDLIKAATDELQIDSTIIEEAIGDLAQDEILAIENRTPQTFVYLRSLYISETAAASNLDNFITSRDNRQQ